MKKALPLLAIFIVIPLVVFFYTKRKKCRTVEKTFLYFDTFVHITCYPPKGINIDSLFTCIDDELERIHAHYGYQSGSFCRQIAIHHDTMTLSEEEKFILAKSLELSKVTGGAFDISVGLLENIWGFSEDEPHLPEEEEIQSALFRTGYQYILLADDKVILAKTGMVIDLGGISKGYAVDRVVKILHQEGVSAGIVDAGGDLKVFGDKPDGRKWAIGIRDPLRAGTIAK
ncbi:MAG: FAD:protein FMN transferase, partial [Candidatus Cloacimonadota bacterium]